MVYPYFTKISSFFIKKRNLDFIPKMLQNNGSGIFNRPAMLIFFACPCSFQSTVNCMSADGHYFVCLHCCTWTVHVDGQAGLHTHTDTSHIHLINDKNCITSTVYGPSLNMVVCSILWGWKNVLFLSMYEAYLNVGSRCPNLNQLWIPIGKYFTLTQNDWSPGLLLNWTLQILNFILLKYKKMAELRSVWPQLQAWVYLSGLTNDLSINKTRTNLENKRDFWELVKTNGFPCRQHLWKYN